MPETGLTVFPPGSEDFDTVTATTRVEVALEDGGPGVALDQTGYVEAVQSAGANTALMARLEDDIHARWRVRGDGRMEFGTGLAVPDRYLERVVEAAIGTTGLKTDGSLQIKDALSFGAGKAVFYDYGGAAKVFLGSPDTTAGEVGLLMGREWDAEAQMLVVDSAVPHAGTVDGDFLHLGKKNIVLQPDVNLGAPYAGLTLTKTTATWLGGDLRVATLGKGHAQKSPDGTYWRLTIANDGAVGAEVVV
jgi:hypothetical protein